MTTNTQSESARQAELEVQYLTALMRRDAKIHAERTRGESLLVGREPVRVVDEDDSAPRRPALSVFEDSYSVRFP